MNNPTGQPVNGPDAPSPLYNYIYWSTLIGLFSSSFYFITVPFHVRLFDAIILVNLLLMIQSIDFARIAKWIPCLILYLAMSGGIGIFNGSDTVTQVAKEFSGISVSLLYFYYFFEMIGNDFERAFANYAKIAFWFAVIALPVWVAMCIFHHGYVRLQGLTSEPGAFCEIVLPAYYWYAHHYFTSRKHGGKVLVFTLAIILSSSSLGYLCVAFGVMLFLSARIRHFVAVPFIVGGLLALAYTASGDFRMRADDTLLALSTQDVSNSNLSTFALISNVFVTQQIIKESPLIGKGLGSYPISHARFIGDVAGIESHMGESWEDINATEAASLTLRTLSELGILGFSGILVFIVYFRTGGSGPYAAISSAILVSYFLKLIRNGNYFPPEQFFFVFIYILTHQHHRHRIRSTISRALPRSSMRQLEYS
jgi:hypothetical protein